MFKDIKMNDNIETFIWKGLMFQILMYKFLNHGSKGFFKKVAK